jgi:hypothetical protein
LDRGKEKECNLKKMSKKVVLQPRITEGDKQFKNVTINLNKNCNVAKCFLLPAVKCDKTYRNRILVQ